MDLIEGGLFFETRRRVPIVIGENPVKGLSDEKRSSHGEVRAN